MVKKGLKNKILYVGLDDSNHAGKKKGEIITAVFSQNYDDSLIEKFQRRRTSRGRERTKRWIDKKKTRDFRFTILPHEQSSKTSYNLFLTAPYLIQNYLNEINNSKVENLEIYFDGKMEKSWERIIESDFQYSKPIKLSNFTGENKTNVPYVLGIADYLSYLLFKGDYGNLETLLKNPKMVPIDFTDPAFIERRERFSNSGKFYKLNLI